MRTNSTLTALVLTTCLFAMALALATPALAQTTADSTIFVLRDTERRITPNGLTKLDIDTTHLPPDLYHLLDSLAADSLVKIFPDFTPADTIEIQGLGDTIILNDLSIIYQLYFANAVDWQDLQALYHDCDSMAVLRRTGPLVLTTITTNDPLLDSQFYLVPSASTISADITDAWLKIRGKRGQRIAVIDDAFETDHEDFTTGILSTFYDGITYGDEPWDRDLENPSLGHGTQMSGIIRANQNNARGIAGINWFARLFAANLNQFGANGDKLPQDQASNAIAVCSDQNNFLTNLSAVWEDVGSMAAPTGNMWLRSQQLVASRGNKGTNEPRYPAGLKSCYSVGALDLTGTRLSNASFGDNMDIVALGENVWTLGRLDTYFGTPGTSPATAIVTGILSLVSAADPTLSTDELTDVLRFTATDVGPVGYDDEFGWGSVNANDAVAYVRSHDFHRMEMSSTIASLADPMHDRDFTILEVPGPLLGTKKVIQWKTTVTFNYAHLNLSQTPDISIRLRETRGWSDEDPNDQFPFARIVSSSATSCDVETFSYQVLEPPDFLTTQGYYPCPTASCGTVDVTVAITVIAPHTPKTIQVPIDCTTVSEAIQEAKDHDTISIAPNIYTGAPTRTRGIGITGMTGAQNRLSGHYRLSGLPRFGMMDPKDFNSSLSRALAYAEHVEMLYNSEPRLTTNVLAEIGMGPGSGGIGYSGASFASGNNSVYRAFLTWFNANRGR